MKTISRLCRRCVAVAFAIVLLVLTVNAAAFIAMCFHFVSDTSASSLRGESVPDAPHILGLHLVTQILSAHGGLARFENRGGACAALICPLTPPAAMGGQT